MVVIRLWECKKWKVDLKNRKAKKANDVTDNVSEDDVPNDGQTFASSLLNILDNDVRYINSRAFVHLSHKRDWFQGYIEIPPMLFYLGDDGTLEAVGMGNIEVIMTMGDKKFDSVFKNAFYILKIVKKIFSMSKGASLGNVLVFGKFSCLIKRDQKVIQVGLNGNCFYKLNSNVKLPRGKSVNDINAQL